MNPWKRESGKQNYVCNEIRTHEGKRNWERKGEKMKYIFSLFYFLSLWMKRISLMLWSVFSLFTCRCGWVMWAIRDCKVAYIYKYSRQLNIISISPHFHCEPTVFFSLSSFLGYASVKNRFVLSFPFSQTHHNRPKKPEHVKKLEGNPQNFILTNSRQEQETQITRELDIF